jgi:YNFM family putative membrane transporter
MIVVLLTTVLTLSALYAPQPLLPVIVRDFGVSRESAALLTTIVFIPLTIAPLFYGYFLESLSPRRMLRVAILLLSGSEAAFFFGESFAALLGIRLFQGMLVPAILTALMTYIAQVNRSTEVQRAMGTYVSATILGGFLGRACSGMIASWLGWRYSFLLLSGSLLVCFFLLRRLAGDTTLRVVRPSPGTILQVLREKRTFKIYLVVFGLFLVFAAVMNFIPFRLTEISLKASEFRIGLMYSGYTMGIVTSLNAVRVGKWVGGEIRTILLGLVLVTLALLGMQVPQVEVLFLVMFLFCGAMFLVHATASGYLNRYAGENKGIVNGLYVSFYYGGGTVGSWLPGFIYRGWGWQGFVFSLVLISAGALGVALSCRREYPAGRPNPP